MKRRKTLTVFLVLALVLGLAGMAAAAKQTKYATGPFTYYPASCGEATFLGAAGSPVTTEFTIYAPSGGTKFPSADTAPASIRVFGIEKVKDADGNDLLTPEDIPLDSPLGSQIAGAFTLSPTTYTFSPGGNVVVSVTVANPIVAEWDYGTYVVVMKAQSPGSGVGVGSGSRFTLTLKAMTMTDTTPPTVTINSPTNGSSHILGPISVSITANDPVPGSGVASITAKVSSAGGAVSDLDIPLNISPSPVVSAGTNAEGTGTFTPFGGTGTVGTTLESAFTAANPSGIGSYTLTATAKDAAGNTANATSGFKVNYDIQFLNQEAFGKDKIKFNFLVKRFDGTFMFDKTVEVRLYKSDNTHIKTNLYGTGDIKDNVQINLVDSSYQYQTQFHNLTKGTTYYAELWFADVDGKDIMQAKSDNITIPN